MRFGPDPVREAVGQALEALDKGNAVTERSQIDLKEEAGRRDKSGRILPSMPQNEKAAEHLAGEVACMANTPEGGALIVGVDKASALIGTDMEPDWLRARLYELLDRRVTVEIRVVEVRGVRLLVLIVPEAIEPIRFKGRLHWRLDDKCVEIDPTSWHSRRAEVLMLDWSAQASNLPESQVRSAAVEQVREFLRQSVDSSANELAEAPTSTLLRRLNAVRGDGMLTNAGALLFMGRPEPCLDYIRRDAPAGDSVERVRASGRSLVEQLAEVFAAARAFNPQRHVSSGLVAGQVRLIPERALREAIVNGVAHREWGVGDPTTVEHVANTLRVSSPGGFVGGVTADNIINHPSKSRNTALTELLASIKVAEREGVGVDRMVRDMLRYGHRLPDIREHGSGVVTSLVGGQVDLSWMAWIDDIGPSRVMENLHHLMAMHLLVGQGWIDDHALSLFLQVGRAEASQVTFELCDLSIGKSAWLLAGVDGVPDGVSPAYILSSVAREALNHNDGEAAVSRPWPSRVNGLPAPMRERAAGSVVPSWQVWSVLGHPTSNESSVGWSTRACSPPRDPTDAAQAFSMPTSEMTRSEHARPVVPSDSLVGG